MHNNILLLEMQLKIHFIKKNVAFKKTVCYYHDGRSFKSNKGGDAKVTDTELFYKAVEESGYRLSFIAKQIGITVQSLRLKSTNQREFTASEVDKLAKLFNKSIEEVKPIFFTQVVA